jgi:hypothetical protein
MKFFRRSSLLILLLGIAASALAYSFWRLPVSGTIPENRPFPISAKTYHAGTGSGLREKASQALAFARANNLNTDYCFLVDMKQPSGKNRFFVYNLQKDSVEVAGLVAHGLGSDVGGDNLYFSNTPNSYCTSLGRYRIGKSYMGKYGLSYLLYGLDESNSKALERSIVLHGYYQVPDQEVYPFTICESLGCPMVSPSLLTTLKKILDKAQKPLLLWIYY